MGELGDASGQPRQSAGLDGRAHAVGHFHGIARLRDGGIEQYRGAAELERQRGIGCGADAGVENDRLGVLLWSYVTSPGRQAIEVLRDMGYGPADFARWGGQARVALFLAGAIPMFIYGILQHD